MAGRHDEERLGGYLSASSVDQEEPSADPVISKRAILALNAAIVAAYVAIAVFTPAPWVMFGAFLLLAIVIRCATLWWIMTAARHRHEELAGQAFAVIAWNLLPGLLFAGTLFGVLWTFAQFWPSVVKTVVALLAVFVAYSSTFPLAQGLNPHGASAKKYVKVK